jgi:phenylalanine-4-hydroxylase
MEREQNEPATYDAAPNRALAHYINAQEYVGSLSMDAVPRLDPRSGRVIPPDFLVPQEPERYTAQDHTTWRTLFDRQTALLRGRVVPEYYAGLEALGITDQGIPDFAEMNEVLARATGWRVVAVPGLVPDTVFFAHLAARRFPAGYWIRSADQLDYIEEPDVFHDVFGHVPLLMQPSYADYIAAYGGAGLAYAGQPALANLARLYWYTVEFGLMRTSEGLRIFGAGILSSAGESVYALESARPLRVAFDCERVLCTRYEIDHFQDVYFVLSGYDDLPALRPAELDAHIAAARAAQEIAASARTATDRIISSQSSVGAPG